MWFSKVEVKVSDCRFETLFNKNCIFKTESLHQIFTPCPYMAKQKLAAKKEEIIFIENKILYFTRNNKIFYSMVESKIFTDRNYFIIILFFFANFYVIYLNPCFYSSFFKYISNFLWF